MSVVLGRRIKALRRLKRITQQELAAKMSISVTTLSNIERGHKIPQPHLLEKMADSLGVSEEELFNILDDGVLSENK